MEENELEEGEAFPGQDEDIDPDSLSYIDKKLQDVLGHFQKEFEGGVSAETLGAKFGGYGSFLPAYQRSPILSHPKSPMKVPIHNVSRSLCNLQSEVGFQTDPIPVLASNTKDNSTSATQLTEKSGKRDTFNSACNADGIAQAESASKSVNIGDQKSLKVRIKLGPDNVMARNNPEIYSDLGLDVSPSPSLEDSPSGSRELSPESPNSFCDSPSTILQVMTCFSIPGGYLLSPLSESLLQSLEKEVNFLRNFKPRLPRKFASENCADSSNISMHSKDVSGSIYKKSKCRERGQNLVQAHGLTSEKVTATSWKNELGGKTPASKEEHHIVGDLVKDGFKMFDVRKVPNKISAIERIHAVDLGKMYHLQTDGTDHLEKTISPSKGNTIPKSCIAGKASEETSGNDLDSKFDVHGRKSKSKTQKNSDIKKANSDRHSVRKDYTASQEEFVKEKSAQKSCSSEKFVLKSMQDKGQAFEGEGLIKGGQSSGLLVEPNKEILNALFSVSPKVKKKTSYVKGVHLESNSKISKSNKDLNKVHKTDSQRDFVVTAHTKHSENGEQVVGSSRSTEKLKERSVVNNVDNICVAGPATIPPASMSDAVPNLDPTPSVPALVLIKDNWVCCDICQNWRLLPYGTNPESLPKKWQCSMQVWLPGLNTCNISQDKTTKAFHELYQFPAPVGDTNLTTHLDNAASSITSADTMNLGRRPENDIHHAILSGKKKIGVMDADMPNVSPLMLLPNSSKNLQVSSGKEELIDVGSVKKSKPANTGLSIDSAAEMHIHKERHKIPSSYRNGAGDLNDRAGKYSKQMGKRGIDVDVHRTSKKLKKDNSYHSMKVLHSGVDTSDKQDANRDTDLLANADRNTLQNYSAHSSFKDFKAKSASSKKSREKVNSSSKGIHKEICSASEAEEPGKYDSNDKKRKLKEWQHRQACQEISVSNQQVVGSRPVIKESLVESELRMQKKAKVTKSEGKESYEGIGGGRIELKGSSSRISFSSNRKHLPDETDNGVVRSTADEQMVHYQEKAMPGQALDCMDGLKRDVIHMHPLAAAASSSSKVSGSQKNKDNLPEARGSPVESVSSSPMRILNTENSSRRNSSLKDNVSPKRFSDGEFDGSSDQSGTRTKDQASNACLRSSEVYRSVESGVLDSLKESHGYQDTETNCSPGIKAMDGMFLKLVKHDDVIMSNDLDKRNILSSDGNASHLPNKYHLDRSDKSHIFDEDARCASGQKKSGKSSLHSRDKHRNFNFDSEKGKLKVLGSCTEHKELHAMRTCNNHDADAEFDHFNSSKKDDLESHLKQHKVLNLRPGVAGACQNATSQENFVETTSHERQNPSGLLISDDIDRTIVDVRKGMHLSHKTKDKLEKKVWAPQTTPVSIKGTSSEQHPLDVVDNEAAKPARPSRKYDGQNGTLPNILRQSTANMPGSSSPMKKDGHLNVNAFIKEARDLKHTANRLKSVGSEVESSGIFFESALKFLHAASLLEPHNADSVRQGELVPSTQMLQMYYDTAKFCEFCAHEYERLKELLAAALAYKCAEVAYLKVAYYKNPGASKDRLELQVALDAPLTGESPSSSASDVDNLNNHGGLDKAASARAASSPQIASNHAIASRNHPHVMRLLIYTNHLNCAFDASKKSQSALSAANIDLGKKGIDGVCSVKKVLDFNYHNVEGLLRLVRLSMHSIGH